MVLLRLRVVLLAVDAAAFAVLALLDAPLLAGAHVAVGTGARFLALELRGFARGELAGLQALLDAVLLVDVALDGAGLRERGAAKGEAERGGDGRVCKFHEVLLSDVGAHSTRSTVFRSTATRRNE